VEIPRDTASAEIDFPEGTVKLTNLQKLFWPKDGITNAICSSIALKSLRLSPLTCRIGRW